MNKSDSLALRLLSFLMLLAILVSTTGAVGVSRVIAQDNPPPEVEVGSEYFTLETYTLKDGTKLQRVIINGPPTPSEGADLGLRVEPLEPEGILTDFPSYSWVFGSAAVAGAIIAGYYDRHGYPNMYAGPTDGGVMPLTDTSWPTWTDSEPATYPNNPLVASHAGVDGRSASSKGTIDDYWVKYGSTAPDPYIGSWTEHTWGSAIGDYMKTSQSALPYQNNDGSTSFWNSGDATKLTCQDMETADWGGHMISELDGTYGRKEFYEARGYTVTECYNQRTYNAASGGFSLADLQAEIDAGHPVMLIFSGLTAAAYGYSGSTVYIRDTWDSNPDIIHTMEWGTLPTYDSKCLYAVSVVKLAVIAPAPVEPTGTYWTRDLTYRWTVVNGATQYQYRVWDGATKMWDTTVTSAACDSTYCSDHPVSLELMDGAYKWQVRAKVGGIWTDWSNLKWYAIKAGFNSQFTTDAAGWQPTYGGWTWDLYDGNYRTSGIQKMWSTSRFDQVYGVYTYEVKLRRQGTDMSSPYGILFNGTPWPLSSEKAWNKGYGFLITRDGYYSAWRYDSGVPEVFVDWTYTPVIKPGWYNTLKVAYNKNTGLTLLYINDNLVFKSKLDYFKWGNVGVTMYKGKEGWEQMLVDWAKLTTSATGTSPSP